MNCPRCKWPMFSLGPNQISKDAFLCIYCGDTAFLLDVPAEPEPTAFQGFSRYEGCCRREAGLKLGAADAEWLHGVGIKP